MEERNIDEQAAAQLAAQHLAERDDYFTQVEQIYYRPRLVETDVLPMSVALLTVPDDAFEFIMSLPESLTQVNLRVRARCLTYTRDISDHHIDTLAEALIEPVYSERYWLTEPISRAFAGALTAHRSRLMYPLIEALHSDKDCVRWEAAQILSMLGWEESIPVLMESVNDSDVFVRTSTELALMAIGDGRAVPALLRSWKNPKRLSVFKGGNSPQDTSSPALKDGLIEALRTCVDPVDRVNAARAIGAFGDGEVVKVLGDALVDPSRDVRLAAVTALGSTGETAAVAALSHALRNSFLQPSEEDEPLFRGTLLDSLNVLANPETEMREGPQWRHRHVARPGVSKDEMQPAYIVLTEAIDHPSADTRSWAIAGLSKLQCSSTAKEAVRLLGHDPDEKVRDMSRRVLERMDLAPVLSDLLPMLDDADEETRFTAAGILERSPHPAVLARFNEMLDDADDDMRKVALRALSRHAEAALGLDIDPTGIIPLLNHDDDVIRRNAVKLLGIHGDADILPLLRRAKGDNAAYVRSAALRALRNIADRQIGEVSVDEIEQHMTDALSDPEQIVRITACSSLRGIATSRSIPMLVEIAAGHSSRHEAADSALRCRAIEILEDISGTEAIAAIRLACFDSHLNVSLAAIAALRKSGGANAFPTFIELLRQDGWQSTKASEALIELGNADAVPALLDMIRESNSQSSARAFEVLSSLEASMERIIFE